MGLQLLSRAARSVPVRVGRRPMLPTYLGVIPVDPCMDQSQYEIHREEASFDAVSDLINNLDSYIQTHAPDVYENCVTPDTESILDDLSIDALDRKGPRTIWETTYIRYEYKRPRVTVYVAGVYESDTTQLEKTTVRVLLGEHPDSTVIEFVVHPGGGIELAYEG